MPHDAAWKQNLAASLLEIGGTDEELEAAYSYVRDKLTFDNLTAPAPDTRQNTWH